MFDGEGSEHTLQKSSACERCEREGQVYYTGSSVVHGNPFTPAADTEVEHHYRCEGCGHRWSRLT